MALTIPYVPDHLTRTQIGDFLRGLGIDPECFPRDGSITFSRDAVRFTVVALDENGRPFARGDSVAMHTITIPIRDEP